MALSAMTPRAAQYPLPFEAGSSMLPQDYIITPCNISITQTLLQLPSATTPVVLLLGPAASGKTHLLHWLSSARTCAFVDAAALGNIPASDWLKHDICTLIDGIEKADEAALAQAINHARATGSPLLLSADSAFTSILPDLDSRLKAAHHVHMPDPDDALHEALLHKYFADLQWRTSGDVLAYIATRLPRDMVSLQQFVALADAEGLAQKRALTIPFASAILKRMEDSHVS